MFKMLVCTFFFCFFIGSVFAQEIELSPASQVSVLTIAPGDKAVFNRFGHSALRIKDSIQGIDVVFNYGTFDFGSSQTRFIFKFLKGQLDYYLQAEAFNHFKLYYTYNHRSIYEQVLDIDVFQNQIIFNFLLENLKEENKYYRYDFFKNNCSSKLLDVLEVNLSNKLELPNYSDTCYRFIDLLDQYIYLAPWFQLGFYIILGNVAYQKVSIREQVFLPDYLMSILSRTHIIRSNGQSVPLVSKQGYIFRSTHKTDTSSTFIFWSVVFPFIFLFTLILLASKFLSNKRQRYIIDIPLFFILGIMGCILMGFWIFSSHYTTYLNASLLWASPLYILVGGYLISASRITTKWRYIFLLIAIYSISLILLGMIINQTYHIVFYIILAITAWRGYFLYKSEET